MLKVYTGNKEILKNIKVDYPFPETQLSLKEQFEWIRGHYKENISIFTYSTLIFDYLRILVENDVLTKDNLSILCVDKNLNVNELLQEDKIFGGLTIKDDDKEEFSPTYALMIARLDGDIDWLL